jgi:hypothetical protein
VPNGEERLREAASHGFVVAFLAEEYANLVPAADVQVAEFLASPCESVRVRFA